MKKYNIKVNGVSYEVEVEEVGGNNSTASNFTAPTINTKDSAPASAPVQAPVAAPVASGNAGKNTINSPMPGTIVKINVKQGDSLKSGDVILVLEAMKMENDITAPQDCVISSVNVSQGAAVATGDILVTYN